jgi:selenocysteine-specific elongation factor
MIVGTSGHVDHGKTSLVRALTGVDTDRLAEEKARGISIELGFAYARFDGDDRVEPIGFIDVPGHRKLVQTMIAGAAGIDVGLLVVAADDGPMPQTREHLDILRWLGVTKLVVALTKIDLVDAARIDAAREEIEALLHTELYGDVPVVPISVVAGRGLEALRAAVIDVGRRVVDRKPTPHFRLAIDRVFTLQGIGLVVTGTCFAGSVGIDDQLALLPGGLVARVRGIHAQNVGVERAHAGQRGMWIVDTAIAIESDRIDVVLNKSDEDAVLPFDHRDWRAVRFHGGATACNARIALLDDSGLAQIVFEHPIHVVAGDRFVLRAIGGPDDAQATIAGGVVLDVDVPMRGRRGLERLGFLNIAADDDPRATLRHAIERGAKGIDLERWNVTHNADWSADTFDAEAVADGSGGITLFAKPRWGALCTQVVETLAIEHARAPDAVGPGRDRLRRMAAPSLQAAIFGALIAALKSEGRVAQTGAWLHLPTHRVELSSDDRARFDRIGPLLADPSTANNPPRVRDLARALGDDEAVVRGLLVRLAVLGEVYRVAHDHYFVPEVVKTLARDVAAVAEAEADGVAKAAAFRDRIGVGRKVAIQILEFFDRVGYTRRIGDDHRIIQRDLFDG